MQPNEYQKLAERTECDQTKAMMRICPGTNPGDIMGIRNVRLLHSVIGLMGELGEIASVLQKWLWYGKTFTDKEIQEKLADEGGDAQWYLAEHFNALHVRMEDILKANITKLQVRYPEKYTDQLAADEGRDRAAEAAAVKVSINVPLPEMTMAQRCEQCRGSGIARRDRGGATISETCPKCAGVGYLGELGDSHHANAPVPKSADPYPPGSTCRICVGTGKVWIHSYGSVACIDCVGSGVTQPVKSPTPPDLPQEVSPPEGDTGPMS